MDALALLVWAVIVGGYIFRRYVGNPTTVTILEYQGGILYRKGLRVREATAGQHRVRAGVEKMIILDLRPTKVSFENRGVTLADGATAVYGFSGSARITDLSKALYSARKFSEVPAFVLLCCTRSALNGSSSASLVASRETLTQQIIAESKPRLETAGFVLQNFQFTHLAIAAAPPRTSNPG
jgi:hypothetical protein